ncbi:PH domain-containing protein [Pseudoclavibacter helvolus]|uniref:PH domain-containing protein n=1 Tax=Pseudoclavibacter helvolus TaxID=255205 RepID=UPI000837E26D|nr:PH domain-containing protein [Pseudoclavibacter helvolus]
MRGRPPHPSDQSWDQIFGAPASAQQPGQQYTAQPQAAQYPSQQAPWQQAAPAQYGDPNQQHYQQSRQQHPGQSYGGYAQQTGVQPDGHQQRHYEPLGMRRPEQTIMRVRKHGRRLLLPSLVLIAGFAAAGYNLGALQEATIGTRHAWLLISLAAIVLLGIVPIVVWLQARNRITTHRVVLSHGTLTSETREIYMSSIVDVTVRRNLWQAMFRSGTIVITSVSGHRLRLVDVPSANSVAACIRELSGP